ncbi:MAG: GNAT family N-acetyltransferase [Thermoplasmata archaeon]
MPELRALYDAEIRRDPPAIPGTRVERIGPIVRLTGTENIVLYSELRSDNARQVVAEQADFFRRAGGEAEWKVYGHDGPPELESILAEAGFVPEEPETLVILDLEASVPERPSTPGVGVRRVRDALGVRDAVAANEAAFGPSGRKYSAQYAELVEDPNQALFVAYVGDAPIGSGRLELVPGRSFAGLWGGGVAPAHRRHGIYRALVATRAEMAKAAGYRYLTVDARETSRPILERLGFVPLTTTRPWVLRSDSTGGAESGAAELPR